MKSKPCRYCESIWHFPFQCPDNPKPKKRIAPQPDKVWQHTRRRWFLDHPQDWYSCYICNRSMIPADTTLDHVLPRSGRPDLKHSYENLRPCCYTCNSKKGSQRLENYKRRVKSEQTK